MIHVSFSKSIWKPWLIIASYLLISGCASYHYDSRTVYQGTSSEWKTPHNDNQVTDILFEDMKLDQNRFRVTINKVEYEEEYSSDLYHKEVKTRRDPDLVMILIATPVLWIPCFLDDRPFNMCFGGNGRWRYVSKETKNTHASGQTRPASRPLKRNYDTLVTLVSYDENKKLQDRGFLSIVTSKGGIDIELKDAVKSLPQKPTSLDIIVGLTVNGKQYQQKWPFNEQQVAALNLYSEHWLPLQVRKDNYMQSLKKALLADDHSKAVIQFQKLEALEIPLPDSFYFKYGFSLNQISEKDKARKYIVRYISNAGREGKYYLQALELLNN